MKRVQRGLSFARWKPYKSWLAFWRPEDFFSGPEMIILLTSALVFGMTAVYEPNSIIPKYYVRESPQGEYRVYDSKQIVIPKYIVKPDSTGKYYKVYEAGNPVLPVYRIEKRDGKY